MTVDIVARGRSQARQAIALLLIPFLANTIQAVLARSMSTVGFAVARLVVLVGFLCFVYMGSLLSRKLVALYIMVICVVLFATTIDAMSRSGILTTVLGVSYLILFAAGVVLLHYPPPVQFFYAYQQGRPVHPPTPPDVPRGLTRA